MIAKKKNIFILLILFVSIMAITACVILVYNYTDKPVLKVTTSGKPGWLWTEKKHCYIVTKHGNTQYIEEYVPKDVETYDLNEIDSYENIEGNVKTAGDKANKIISEMNNCSPGNIFIINNRYFISVKNSAKEVFQSTLFELDLSKCSLKKIADFPDFYILHVELYN